MNNLPRAFRQSQRTVIFFILTFLLIGIANNAHSAAYLGVYLGYADRHIAENKFFTSGGGFNVTQLKTTGLAERLMAGYQFHRYFSVEAAYTALPRASADIITIFPEIPTANTRSSAYLLDFLFKGQLKIKSGFTPYAKLGIAYVNSVITRPGSQDANAKDYRPAFALGSGFQISPHFTLNGEWYRVLKNSNAFNGLAHIRGGGLYAVLPKTDLFMVGINYCF